MSPFVSNKTENKKPSSSNPSISSKKILKDFLKEKKLKEGNNLLVSVVVVLFGGLFCPYNIQHNATQSLIWSFHISLCYI